MNHRAIHHTGASIVNSEIANFGKLIKAANIKAD